ncbi:alpha/beta-hydrolase [Trametes coccinea BRFM310]|uniref:Alpha/beta-hydrolase n=1 Tax=Trametes coccinea (strain BRFM310) TaxID=1353009 RepID=A0A1Y2IDZ7_TRAC3|nr:alpha/beta-hydrolase [Trametes coccinea BRFM310]
MDPSFYKDTTTSRGLTYHYYHSPAAPGKPTLLFLHGFPSSSYDWHRQVEYFQPKGYGLIVPDDLGAGGSSKPENLEAFRFVEIARDMAEVLDAAGVEKVVGIGHDWGSVILSRMANLFSERFHGFAWVAVWYSPPGMGLRDIDATIMQLREQTGTDHIGYWKLFLEEDGHKLCEQNIDSFIQLIYPNQPEVWREWINPAWKSKEWIEANRTPGRPSWLSEEEYNTIRENLVRSGLKSQLNYYKVSVTDLNDQDSNNISQEALQVRKPVLFIAASKDLVSTPATGKAQLAQYAPHAKIVELDVGHWVMYEATEQLNRELEAWIESLPLSK